MPLFQLKPGIPVDCAEVADGVLLEFGSGNWSVLENVISQHAWLVGVSADRDTLESEWQALQSALAVAGVAVLDAPSVETLADADWRESYKAHFHAWQFGRLHWVPVWQRSTFRIPPDEAVLWLDPGLAFGTGNHETTRLCIERLVTIEGRYAGQGRAAEDATVIDAGCGSGILALSAVLLGFGHVTGFDNDPEAVRISEENAAANNLAGYVRFFTGDLTSGLANRRADIVMANIQADVLVRFADVLIGAVAPGGTLILSGILAHENYAVRSAFARFTPGWSGETRTMGEWSDVALTRPSSSERFSTEAP